MQMGLARFCFVFLVLFYFKSIAKVMQLGGKYFIHVNTLFLH